MAFSIRSLLGLSSRRFGQTLFRTNIIQGKRFLYTEQSLGLQGYEFTRNNFQRQFTNVEDTFRSKMSQICEDDTSMIFTEDLKAILHLAKKDSQDLELITKMIRKFHKQNQDLRFGNFIFGPVVMRTLYYLDAPDVALEVFNDPTLGNFFDQMITYQLLMCLLYKNQRYEDMKTVYDRIKTKHVLGNPFPRNSLLLVLAACYKLNNPESLKYAINIWSELAVKNFEPHRRAATFMAALALKQNSPQIAMEIVSTIKTQRYIDCRCLKILVNLELNRYNDVLMMLRSSVQHDGPQNMKDFYFSDVIQKTEDVMKEKNPPEAEEVLQIISLLRSHGQVATMTLDEHICAPIQHDMNAQRRARTGESELDNRLRGFVPRMQRPGLRDLV